jgi:hypothetical protein
LEYMRREEERKEGGRGWGKEDTGLRFGESGARQEREKETHTERQRDTHREAERDRERQRETERDRELQRADAGAGDTQKQKTPKVHSVSRLRTTVTGKRYISPHSGQPSAFFSRSRSTGVSALPGFSTASFAMLPESLTCLRRSRATESGEGAAKQNPKITR